MFIPRLEILVILFKERLGQLSELAEPWSMFLIPLPVELSIVLAFLGPCFLLRNGKHQCATHAEHMLPNRIPLGIARSLIEPLADRVRSPLSRADRAPSL